MKSRAHYGLGIALVVLASGMLATQGSALTFDVDTENDGPDNTPGDGICATLIGPCTLRAAIEEANALGGAHTINLPQGSYNAGDHNVTADISILGPSGLPVGDRPVVIGGGPTFTVFSGARLSLTGVSILYGDSSAGRIGGCLENDGEFEFTDGGFYACTGRFGGAVANTGILTMTRCEVEDSDAVDTGGSGSGGGLSNNFDGTATLTEVVFRRNTAAAYGGAIINSGSLTLTDCWIDDNESGLDGGGVYSLGEATLTRVTVSRNTALAGAFGGGIAAQGTMTLTNATVHGNQVSAASNGGGLHLSEGTFALVNVTVYDNFGGLITGSNATVQVANTIFWNLSFNCILSSPVTSFGHNLEVFSDICGLNGPGDLVDSSITVIDFTPRRYGGFGETLALYRFSPGIDDGDNAFAPPADQNGVLRWDGDSDGTITADIGAYEYGPFFADGFESGNSSRWSTTVP